MAIERMTFIDIKGGVEYLDEVLIRCARCGLFQPENAARLSEYSVGSASMLRNPYGALKVKLGEIATELGIEPEFQDDGGATDSQPAPESFVEQIHAYLDNLRAEYPRYILQQRQVGDEIASYSAALEMLRHVRAPDIDFDRLWANRFLKIRFGRLPSVNLDSLPEQDDAPYEFYQLGEDSGFVWCLYLTAGEFRDDVDALFASVGFERLHIPDYVHGTASDAISFIQEGLVEERERLRQSIDKLAAFVLREKDRFFAVYTRVHFLYDAYDLRRYTVIIRGQFHVIGYVLTRERDAFTSQFADIPTVLLEHERADANGPIPVPVRLRNNWFVRPFEMFVNMYGSPSYNDIDPTPFVAVTYSVLFGMMFGDLGHGLCVFLLGLFLGSKKNMDLGRIMSRVGVVSMGFGFAYGSVFGFEHLLDPVFRGVFGFAEKPIRVMEPAMTNLILVAAIVIGAATILMVILFNVLVGIKHGDFDRVILSNNGLAGLTLYGAVLYAAYHQIVNGVYVLTTPFILLYVALPLLLMFFREPIVHLAGYWSKESIIHSDRDLEESTHFQEGGVNIPEIFHTQFVAARFGRLPIDSYKKLTFYQNEPFMIYPIKTDREYIWCIYATATVTKEEIDAIFHDLFFERIFIPDEDMATTDRAESFIKRCVNAGTTETISNAKYGDVTIGGPKSLYRTVFPSGFGGFVTETFFEMFEVILSFITNTMSFLRVGGFILVHAGMMEVVFKLSEMVGGAASPVIIVVGNIFVMAMEGLIVGIQVLRLEFYEIFSRFFDASGEPFRPFSVNYAGEKP